MDEKSQKKASAQVIQFPRAKQPPAKVVQTISGYGNVGVVGDGNNVQINLSNGFAGRGIKYVVQPGPQHIGPAEAAEVRELVSKTAAITGRDHAFVWSTIKREYRFARYELLTPEIYEQVCQYLRRWIARHTANPASSTEDRRKHLLKRIHVEARKRRDALDQIHAYVLGRFGTNSLADLAPGQLQEIIKEFRL